MIRITPDTQRRGARNKGAEGGSVPTAPVRSRHSALGLWLVPLAAPFLGGCVELFPELEWDVEAPFGVGLDESTPGVVNSSGEMIADKRPDTRAEAESLLAAAIEARESAPVDAQIPVLTLKTGAGEPYLEGGGPAESSGGVEEASASLDPRTSPVELAPEPVLEPVLEPTDLTAAEVPAVEPSAEELPELVPNTVASDDLPDDGADSSPRLDQTIALDSEFEALRSGVLGDAGPTATFAADLGFWFGRIVVDGAIVPIGRVLDLHLDLENRRVEDVLVQFTCPTPYSIPPMALVPMANLRDGLPFANILILEPADPMAVAGSLATEYSDLVRLAFEASTPTALVGTVTSVETIHPEGGPSVVVVKLRDSVNLLHRLDLGLETWFQGTGELPRAGESFAVQAVMSRDERGLIWRVAAIHSGSGLIELRDSKGVAQRSEPTVEAPVVVLRSASSLIGAEVHLKSSEPQTAEGAIGALAGLLMERESGLLSYALLRPTSNGDRNAFYLLVPLERLTRADGADYWSMDLDEGQLDNIPQLAEDSLIELDGEARRLAVQGFWRMGSDAASAQR